jgi:hypothetical protein
MGPLSRHASQDVRTLLRTLGVDEYHATMMIAHMFIAPATTDLDMPPVIVTIRHLQGMLNHMGAGVPETGQLNVQTGAALDALIGPGWMSAPWYEILQAALAAHERGVDLTPRRPPPAMGFVPDLPRVPGGILGWAALAGAAYYFLVHRRP